MSNKLFIVNWLGGVQVDVPAGNLTIALGGSTGAYPYAPGLRFDVDLTQVMGSRISNIEVKLKDETS